MKNAIILAGGKATRLGPLAAQLNKCLITVGQQPMLVHQVNVLRDAGVQRVIVVTSPTSQLQVRSVADQVFTDLDVDVHVITQSRGTSPVNAMVDGLEWILANCGPEQQSAYVLAADTLIDKVPFEQSFTWAHCVIADPSMHHRSWTLKEASGVWADRPAVGTEQVYTGLMYCQSVAQAYGVLAPFHTTGRPFETSRALNLIGTVAMVAVDANWQDVGDLDALSEARRSRYIARDSHRLELDGDGIVWKHGAVEDEKHYMQSLGYDEKLLFPRVHLDRSDAYGTDHIDQPTLAELWLYWPGDNTMWASILERLCARMERTMWCKPVFSEHGVRDIRYWQGHATKMYVDQLVERLHHWSHPIFEYDRLIINGSSWTAGRELLAKLRPLAHQVAQSIMVTPMHGDLSFMNILWSVSTGQPKLLDPRGSFGKHRGVEGDYRYDLAKLRYSYNGGIAAILHGLFTVEWNCGPDVQFSYTTPRVNAVTELDKVLERYANNMWDVKVLEAVMCLSGSTVHTEREALALYARGVQLANLIITAERPLPPVAGDPATTAG